MAPATETLTTYFVAVASGLHCISGGRSPSLAVVATTPMVLSGVGGAIVKVGQLPAFSIRLTLPSSSMDCTVQRICPVHLSESVSGT